MRAKSVIAVRLKKKNTLEILKLLSNSAVVKSIFENRNFAYMCYGIRI